jgi:hypothetical protein
MLSKELAAHQIYRSTELARSFGAKIATFKT